MPKTHHGSLPTHRPTGIPQPVENHDTLETAYAKLRTITNTHLPQDLAWLQRANRTLNDPTLFNLAIDLETLIKRLHLAADDIRSKV